MPKSDIPPQAIATYVQLREKLLLLEIEHPQIAKSCGYSESISGILLAAELILGQKQKGDLEG